jgi:hypothetical protein
LNLAIALLTTVDSGITTQQLKSFDMYVQTGSATFKLESAVITSGNLSIVPTGQFTASIEGQGTKLSRAGNESYTIPGSAQSESATRNPLLVYPVLSIDSLNMSSILSASIQIQNNIEWTAFETIHDSLSVTNSSNAMFPSAYTVKTRTVSGAIQQYQTDDNITQFDDFSTSANITLKGIKMGDAVDATPFFQIALNPTTYTARMTPSEVYMQSYDYSYTGSATLNSLITQYEHS